MIAGHLHVLHNGSDRVVQHVPVESRLGVVCNALLCAAQNREVWICWCYAMQYRSLGYSGAGTQCTPVFFEGVSGCR